MTKCNEYQLSLWLFVRVALIAAVVVNCQLSLIREIPRHRHCRLTHTHTKQSKPFAIRLQVDAVLGDAASGASRVPWGGFPSALM